MTRLKIKAIAIAVSITSLALTGCVKQSEYDMVVAEKTSLETEYNSLQAENAKLKAENAELKTENINLKTQNDKLTNEVNEANAENKVLSELLDRVYTLVYEDESEEDNEIADIRPNESIDANGNRTAEYDNVKKKIIDGYEKTRKAATEIGADVTRDVLDAFVTGDQESAEELRKDIRDEFARFGKNMKELFTE